MIFHRRLFWPGFMQAFAMLAPLLYLRAALGHGSDATVQGEFVLSIIGFGAIAIDFSASTFLAKSQSFLLKKGALLSILLGRLFLASVLLLLYIAFLAFTEAAGQSYITISLVCMLLALVFDPSWIYIGKGYLWIPAAIGTTRFGIAALLATIGTQPIFALTFAFLFSSILFASFAGLKCEYWRRPSWRLCLRIARLFYKPTMTESMTAVFSRLDIAIAVVVLPTNEVLVYAVCRKLIMGLQSVAFSGARIFYLERDPVSLKSLRSALLKNTLLVLVTGLPVSMAVATMWFNLEQNSTLIITLVLLSSLLLIGYRKTLVQFGHLYVNRKFSSDLLFSGISMASFLGLCALLAQFGTPTAISFAVIRIIPDVVYLMMAHVQREKKIAT